MIWLAFPAFVFLTVRLAVVLVNLFSKQRLRSCELDHEPMVSVLIPARDEEKNLPGLVSELADQTYKNLEIWIYNDQSTDRTLQVIRELEERYPVVHGLDGKDLPTGWNGKNHACDQLSQVAGGEYLLFLDADVHVAPDLVLKAVQHTSKFDLTLLSVFPVQRMVSFGEQLTVPVMNWILLSLLPLRLVRLSHYSSLSAANGQFMLFRGREYRQHRFHRLVKDIHVEDIHIIRWIKKMGYPAHTVLSQGEVSCRMYKNLREGVFGFTRSIFAFFGGSGFALFLFTVFTTAGILFVWLGMGWLYAVIYLFIAVLIRLFVTLMSRQPVGRTLLYSPLIQLIFVGIVFQSFLLRAKGINEWKGRIIKFRGI